MLNTTTFVGLDVHARSIKAVNKANRVVAGNARPIHAACKHRTRKNLTSAAATLPKRGGLRVVIT